MVQNPKTATALQEFSPVDELMAWAQYDPQHGYYQTQNPFGAAGDFTTGPEISQMLGEVVGAWLLDQWLQQEKPNPFFMLELGPGRGTLMRDILRVFTLVPGALDALRLIMFEVNPVLRAQQQEVVQHHSVIWVATLDEALQLTQTTPLWLVANEFFDALPIQQLVFQEGWHERGVISDSQSRSWEHRPYHRTPWLDGYPQPQNGDILEQGDLGAEILTQIASYQRSYGGCQLIIDYGYATPSYGDTLQAVSKHRVVDVLASLGKADLSAHVNFYRYQKILEGLTFQQAAVESQRAFLMRFGFLQRLQRLCHGATPQRVEDLSAQAQRLLDPQHMGLVFKVLTAVP